MSAVQFGISETGLVRVGLEDHVRAALRSLLLTRLGERPLRPELGSNLVDHLYRRFTPGLRERVSESIRDAIAQGESRVELQSADTELVETEPDVLQVQIRYRIRETGQSDSLRFAL